MPVDQQKFRAVGHACSLNRLGRAFRSVSQIYDAKFKDLGVRASQGMLLIAIGGLGSPGIGELAEEVSLDPTTLTRNLKPLARSGLVSVVVGDDRRRREVHLTDTGEKLAVELAIRWNSIQYDLANTFGAPWSKSLETALAPVDARAST